MKKAHFLAAALLLCVSAKAMDRSDRSYIADDERSDSAARAFFVGVVAGAAANAGIKDVYTANGLGLLGGAAANYALGDLSHKSRSISANIAAAIVGYIVGGVLGYKWKAGS